jgi:hypothetical protein
MWGGCLEEWLDGGGGGRWAVKEVSEQGGGVTVTTGLQNKNSAAVQRMATELS